MKASKSKILIIVAVLIIAFCAGFFAMEWWQSRRESAAAVMADAGSPTADAEAANSSAAESEAPGGQTVVSNQPGAADEVSLSPEQPDTETSELTAPSASPSEASSPSPSPTMSPSPSPSASSPASSSPKADSGGGTLSGLKEEIEESIGDLTSQWDVYVERLSDGAAIHSSRNLPDDGRMISASIIKIFVMAAVYDGVNRGTIDESAVTADLKKMITVSDNDATNRLIDQLGGGDSKKGFDVVNAYAAGIGCTDTQLNRRMLDWSDNLQNYTTGRDCAKLLRLIYSGNCVSGAYSDKMMALLKAQEKTEGLLTALPKSVETASKPGFISGVSIGEVGIVFASQSDYIVCVICNKPYTDNGAMGEITEISTMVYDFFAES